MKLKTLLKLYRWPFDDFDIYDKDTGKFLYSTRNKNDLDPDTRINCFSVFGTTTAAGDRITILELWF